MSVLPCFVAGHRMMHPRQQRDSQGNVRRGALEYECRHCGIVLAGTVDLTPSWALLARLRRQVSWAREQSRQRRRA